MPKPKEQKRYVVKNGMSTVWVDDTQDHDCPPVVYVSKKVGASLARRIANKIAEMLNSKVLK